MIVNNRVGSIKPATPTRQQTAIHLVQSSRFARRLARWLLIGLALSVVGMAFFPWQQTSRGTGSVVAYVPQERQQTVQSPVQGVVARVAPGLVDGSKVKKGDFILEIEPFVADAEAQLRGQVLELKTKLETANIQAGAYGKNVEAYTIARDSGVSAAEQMLAAARAKLSSKQRLVAKYEANRLQAELNYNRQKGLAEDRIKPEVEIEKLKRELDGADAELLSAQQEVEAARNEALAKENELEEKRNVAQTYIDYARAMQQDALGKAATIRKEISDIEMKLSGLQRRTIEAPRDGTIFRMPVYELGQTLKEGEPVVTIVPEVTQKAVELLVPGNDMPLIEVGQEVRLQFEGWPAVQFAGWPSVAVGTFGGKVANVDATDNGKGQFRILITPYSESEPWPSERFLRQGVRANGWVMLRRVTIGYEIWRQLNGFPVMVAETEPKETTKVKPPKID